MRPFICFSSLVSSHTQLMNVPLKSLIRPSRLPERKISLRCLLRTCPYYTKLHSKLPRTFIAVHNQVSHHQQLKRKNHLTTPFNIVSYLFLLLLLLLVDYRGFFWFYCVTNVLLSFTLFYSPLTYFCLRC